MKRCTWDCSSLHAGGTIDARTWYCTSDDARKEPLPEDCHDARKGMVLAAFEYGQECALEAEGRLF